MNKQTIQEIKQNVSPVQAIEFYTGQRGSHRKYLCPFHNDKHPSLTVKGEIWTCWSCGEKGDVIDFVRKYHSIGFREAVVKLAQDFNVPIEFDHVQGKNDRELVMWDRIKREADRENKKQLCSFLESEINDLNLCHRILFRHDPYDPTLEQYAADLDYLIAERRKFGEYDWREGLTTKEVELHDRLQLKKNYVDPELVSLLTSSRKGRTCTNTDEK